MSGRAAPADVAVGTELPEQVFRVTRADLVRYAGASGDFNPIHWNERVAPEVGLPGVIAHGMFTMALAARAVTDWAGDPGALVEYHVRFGRPVARPRRRRPAPRSPSAAGSAALLEDGRAAGRPDGDQPAARRCSPSPAPSSAWHDARRRCGASRRCRRRAAPARLHVLRRHARRRGERGGAPAGRGPPPGPTRRPAPPTGPPPTPTGPGSHLEFRLEDDRRTVTGTETVIFTPDLAVDELVFRLIPNAPDSARTGSRLDRRRRPRGRRRRRPVRGRRRGGSRRALRRGARRRARRGGVHRVALDFTLTLGGPFDRFGTDEGVSWWGSGAPLLAWEPGVGWARDPSSRSAGETTTSPAADTTVEVSAPEDLTVLMTGDQAEPRRPGRPADVDVGRAGRPRRQRGGGGVHHRGADDARRCAGHRGRAAGPELDADRARRPVGSRRSPTWRSTWARSRTGR